MSGEHCAEHSGFEVRLNSIDDKMDAVASTQVQMNAKLDYIQEHLNSVKIRLETEKVENKWKHRVGAIIWGAAGGGGVWASLKALGKWI